MNTLTRIALLGAVSSMLAACGGGGFLNRERPDEFAVQRQAPLVVTVWMFRERLMGDILGLALILGGALGNIKDRYDLGYVVDYADFHIGEFRPFLIFNIADAAITIGVLIILARAFFMRDKADDETVDGTIEGRTADAAESN